MARSISRTGKKTRPKTAVKGKRYLCAKCRKRSPRPVKTPAPWYCPECVKKINALADGLNQDAGTMSKTAAHTTADPTLQERIDGLQERIDGTL